MEREFFQLNGGTDRVKSLIMSNFERLFVGFAKN